MEPNHGAFITFKADYGGQILFSASIPRVNEKEFGLLWETVGGLVYREVTKEGAENSGGFNYRIEVHPIQHPH